MSLRQTAAPTSEPVTLDELKQHLRIDGDDENDLLTSLLIAARSACEGAQNRAYVSQTFEVTLDRFPNGGEQWRADMGFVDAADLDDPGTVNLPRPPLAKVTGITYVDSNGATQTLSTSDYAVDNKTEPGRIVPAYSESWPSPRTQRNAITITYVAGYATPFTADASTNIVTASGRTFADGDLVRLTNISGALPTGLSANTDYYVRDASGSTFKLAATAGGSAIDITGAGTGTHFVGEVPAKVRLAIKCLVGHYYENREGVGGPMPATVESLLWQDRNF